MNRPKIATYYSRLKVAQDAPPEVIRAAYKALVQKYHPDKHDGSIRHEQLIIALNKAQEVLLDPARRGAHDQWIRDEEVRLGWRAPNEGFEPGFWLRCRLMLASVRLDGLPWSEALRMHFKPGQRLGLGLGLLLVPLLVGGAMALATTRATAPSPAPTGGPREQARDDLVSPVLAPVVTSVATPVVTPVVTPPVAAPSAALAVRDDAHDVPEAAASVAPAGP